MKTKIKSVILVLALVCICSFFGAKEAKAASPYLIKINKQQCVVTIYKQDKKGKYTKPVKAMLCSPGSATPLGSFPLKEKIRWHTLDGPCYGQYCSRINGGVLFHSVWYYQPKPNTLSCAQFNNLGSRVSHGCVRLCVRDAKWVYDNCPSGTTVVIYNSKNPGPLGKPKSIKLSGYTGWDPTDVTNPDNPWNKKKPTITGAKNKNIVFASSYNIKKGLTVKNTTGFNSKKLLTTKITYREPGSKKYVKVKKVNTRKPGVYKIVYKIKDELGRKAQKTVKHKVLTKVSVSKIVLNHSSRTLYLGGSSSEKTTKLKVKSITPKKASIKKLKVTSSNKSIATVTSAGKVTAKKAGTCTITYTATDGSGTKATCKIIVRQKATSLALRAPSTRLAVGKTMKLVPVFGPADVSNQVLSYTSSNNAVATIGADGTVTAKAAGTVTFTAKTTDGTNKTASVTITVVHEYAGIATGPSVTLEVRKGTLWSDIATTLGNTVVIQDVSGNKANATITWNESAYRADEIGKQTVSGQVALPAGWFGTIPPYQVTITVYEMQ